MTIEARDKLGDRERIKQFIEASIRNVCDEITNAKLEDSVAAPKAIDNAVKLMVDMSQIYSNMRLDKEGEI